MTKSPWEDRVGMLLDPRVHPQFVYSFKPFDSAMYGGQPRIDWLAADTVGRFWMIEVKSLAAGRKSFNLESGVSAGQRQALSAMTNSVTGVSLLAIGHEKTLYFYDWRKIRWLLGGPAPQSLLLLTQADLRLEWSGPKSWNLRDLYGSAFDLGMLVPQFPPPLSGIPPMPTISVPSSLLIPTDPSLSTSKPSNMRQRRRKLLATMPSSADG